MTPAGTELYGIPRMLKFISLQQRPHIRGRSLLCVGAKILITFVDQFKIHISCHNHESWMRWIVALTKPSLEGPCVRQE